MSPSSRHDPDDEFADVVERLRAAKAEADPLELDRIKTTAMARAERRGVKGRRSHMRRTMVIAMVTGSLMIGGTGAVLAGDNKGDDNKGDDDAAKGQYPCPPGTHGKSCKPCPNDHQGKTHQNGNRDCSPGPKPGSHGSNGSHGNGNQSHSGGSHQSH